MTSSDFVGPESCATLPSGGRKVVLAICALLALAVVLVFCQTGRHEFVNFDDDRYVYDNENIKSGFSLSTLAYFLAHRHSYTYHPVTSYSHLLDYQLFGLHAGRHHWTNLILHAATAIALFLVLRLMTGRLWPSAMTAAVFAIHPLRVESVAWISERRDVLSGLLLMLTLWAYAVYSRRPHELWRYVVVCVLFALGLLAKPMLVTLPLLLLLLDYWPLGRWRFKADKNEFSACDDLPQLCMAGEHEAQEDVAPSEETAAGGDPFDVERDRSEGARLSRSEEASDLPPVLTAASEPSIGESRRVRRHFPWGLLTEKIPLALLALADCAVTLYTQGDGGAIQSLEIVSWTARLANMPIAYANYIGSFFWPQRLAVLYPHPCDRVDGHDAIQKACLLAVVSVAALLLARRMPYLLVGWLWYLIALLPVIGLLQVGGQSMADRYTYLPQIGLAIAVVWALTAAAERLGSHSRLSLRECSATFAERKATICEPNDCCRVLLAIASVGILAALAAAAWRQTSYWRDSETLWNRELSFPQYNNVVAHYNLGLVLAEGGRHLEAVEQYTAALARDPSDEASRLNLGLSYEALGNLDSALQQYRKIVNDNPQSVSGQNNLARLLKTMDGASTQPETRKPKRLQDTAARIDQADHELHESHE